MRSPPAHPDVETYRLATRPADFSYQRFGVRVIEGPGEGQEFRSDGPELSIGSDPNNDLVLSDPAASRHHCVITATPDGFELRDLDSTNGTFLAGYRVAKAWLTDDAVLEIGLSKLAFHRLDGIIREELSRDSCFGGVLGHSVAMARVLAVLPKLAASDATVLLEGETGTGKGLVAEAIHEASSRAAGPFVVVDCGSIPPSLIESELFGHLRGAFTGATVARAGAFEAAQGGTVFLDEIGELPLELQPKLLRVLEERTVKRLGARTPVPLNVRFLSATNRDLRVAVNRGTFRSDLYYRLDTVRLRIPPLRERPDDIPVLAQHFYRDLLDDPSAQLSPGVLDTLARHDWPGNVRELRSALERAVVTGDLGPFAETSARVDDGTTASRRGPVDVSVPFRVAKERAVAEWEQAYLRALMEETGGNLSQAARTARMDRGHLRTLLQRYGLGGPAR